MGRGEAEPSRRSRVVEAKPQRDFWLSDRCLSGERRRRRGGPSALRRSAGAVGDGHRDGGFAEAPREAIGHRPGARSTVVGLAGRAGVRALARRLGTSVGAETPGSPSIPAASQGGRSWLGRSSCSPAQRGCLRGVRRGECGRSLPNGRLPLTNRPLRGLARIARIAMEPCVRHMAVVTWVMAAGRLKEREVARPSSGALAWPQHAQCRSSVGAPPGIREFAQQRSISFSGLTAVTLPFEAHRNCEGHSLPEEPTFIL